jgi:hypothetical protein
MDVELKTGGMARMLVGRGAANQGTGFRNQVSVNSQEESLTGKSSGVRGVFDRA